MPYRIANPPPPPSERTLDKEEEIGLLRTTHRPTKLARIAPIEGLVVAACILTVGGVLVGQEGIGAVLLTVPFAAIAFVLLSWSWFRTRGTAIELHAAGLVIVQRRRRTPIAFSEVDEVWYEMAGRRILRLRLVLHGGAVHLIPLVVNDPLDMANWIFRHCSSALIPDALAALRAGETLNFGRVRVSQDAIEGDSFRIEWSRISIVRLQPGRVLLVRSRWSPFGRTIRFDRVPHPMVFIAAVRACARRVELDDPMGTLAA